MDDSTFVNLRLKKKQTNQEIVGVFLCFGGCFVFVCGGFFFVLLVLFFFFQEKVLLHTSVTDAELA